jgi:hypothetical protein
LIQDHRYFDFAVENHVDEIYLARPEEGISDFGPEIEEVSQDPEWDHVSYAEESKRHLYEQLELLKGMVNYPGTGVSIHHIKTWYALHD